MYWYINKHVEMENLPEMYDVLLERFKSENEANIFLNEHYIPLKERIGTRESINVRINYDDDSDSKMDIHKPIIYQIWEKDYFSDEQKMLGSFNKLEEAEQKLENDFLPYARHDDDLDVSYTIVAKNK